MAIAVVLGGKATEGLVLHWPCVTDHLPAQWPNKGKVIPRPPSPVRSRALLSYGSHAYKYVQAHEGTNPSAVRSDPVNDVLIDEELNDELNKLCEDAKASLHCRDDEAVTEAQQNDDATPVDDAVTE